jgi:hypothetical protein
MSSELKLVPDLVPRSSFFKNLRSLLKSSEWDTVRRAIYQKAGVKCEICGTKGGLDCHEVWEYDEASGIQTLTGLIALCVKCHEVKHVGLAQVRGRLEHAISHMQKVNGIDRLEAEKIIEKAFKTWKRRSSLSWKLDVTRLETLIP